VGKIIRVLILFYDGEPFVLTIRNGSRGGGTPFAAQDHAHTPTFHQEEGVHLRWGKVGGVPNHGSHEDPHG